MPVLKAKKIIKKMDPGDTFTLLADDSGAKADIPALLKKTDCTLQSLDEDGDNLTFKITKN